MARYLNQEERNIISRIQRVKKKTKLTTAIYARKSSEDKSDEALNAQIERCKEIISNHKDLLELKYIFQEEKASGMFADNRKEFQNMIQQVENGEIDAVVCIKLDRFSRDVEDFKKYARIIANSDAILIFGDAQYGETPEAILQLNLLSIISQYYAQRAASDTMNVLIKRAKQGRSNGGSAPFGYYVDKDGYYQIDEHESPIVVSIFNQYLAGDSYTQICKNLKANGQFKRSGKVFKAEDVASILKNEKYIGVYIYNKEGGRKKKHRVLTEHVDEVRLNDGIDCPIIDKDTFNKVQETINNTKKSKHTEGRHQYLLSGILKCGLCGEGMIGDGADKRIDPKTKTERVYYYYACKNRKTLHNSKSKRVNAEYIENTIKTIIYNIILNMKDSMKQISEEYFGNLIKSEKKTISNLKHLIKSHEEAIENAALEIVKPNSTEAYKNAFRKIIDSETVKKNEQEGYLKEHENKLKNLQESSGSKFPTQEELFKNHVVALRLIKFFIKEVQVVEGKNPGYKIIFNFNTKNVQIDEGNE